MRKCHVTAMANRFRYFQMVSCFRSGGSICVPRPAVAGANSLLPKLPEGDTSARDEIRMRMKFGFAKVKAANRMKKLAAAKKEKEKKLLELKYPTVEEIAGGQAEFTAECPNFNPKGGLYGVVDLLTEVSGAVLRVGHASAPQIRLGTGYIEKADEDDERRDVQSHDALVKARMDEAGLRCRDEFVYRVFYDVRQRTLSSLLCVSLESSPVRKQAKCHELIVLADNAAIA